MKSNQNKNRRRCTREPPLKLQPLTSVFSCSISKVGPLSWL